MFRWFVLSVCVLMSGNCQELVAQPWRVTSIHLVTDTYLIRTTLPDYAGFLASVKHPDVFQTPATTALEKKGRGVTEGFAIDFTLSRGSQPSVWELGFGRSQRALDLYISPDSIPASEQVRVYHEHGYFSVRAAWLYRFRSDKWVSFSAGTRFDQGFPVWNRMYEAFGAEPEEVRHYFGRSGFYTGLAFPLGIHFRLGSVSLTGQSVPGVRFTRIDGTFAALRLRSFQIGLRFALNRGVKP